MRNYKRFKSITCITTLLITVVFGAGCATKAQTGALAGAGTGALIGGLANMNGSWGATTLLGAGVGAGLGYLIGNELDKKDAATRQAAREDELKPLSGTTWQVVSVVPKPQKTYKSIIVSFRNNGTVVTTKTEMNGNISRETEKYRIVGSTIIINEHNYVQNYKFNFNGNKLTVDYGNGSAVLHRVN